MAPLVPRPPFLPFPVPTHGTSDWHTFVVHTTEGADGVRNLSGFFFRQAKGFGTTFTITSRGAMGFNGNLNAITWHVKGHNTDYRGCELGGSFARFTTFEWFDKRLTQMWALAWLMAWLHKGGHIDLQKKQPGGIVGHVNVPGNDHTDPGKGFPWGFVIGLAQKWSKTGVPLFVQKAIPRKE
jgi:hypothetical protein